MYRVDKSDNTSRRIIDHAIGVLIGLRGCSPEQAFAELIDVMDQTGLGTGTVSTELVASPTRRNRRPTITPWTHGWISLKSIEHWSRGRPAIGHVSRGRFTQ